MKKAGLILAIVVLANLVIAGAAFADHSPTFFVEWDAAADHAGYAADFGNVGTGSPHQNYLEGTEKCGVCHSVHRAPVPGMKWDTNPADPASKTAVAGGQYNRAEWEVSIEPSVAVGFNAGFTTQMLLASDVANSCDYCHIDTSIGGKQLYAGKRAYRTEGTGLPGSEWDAGFAHHNGCTGCHAVHGAANNYGDAARYGTYGTFQGPIKSKVLKVRAKGTATDWQEETVEIGAAGQGEFGASGIAGAAAWAAAQTPSANVDTKNVPLFPSMTDAINGTAVRPDTSAYNAQSSVFCTFCHQNYGYASEATVNPDGDRSLFQGPWYVLGQQVGGTPDQWYAMGSAPGQGAPFKNHPVKSIYGNFTASGKGSTVPNTVAFVGAESCVACHDAGAATGNSGVLIQSYPHFTPGYFHFVKSASHAGGTMTNNPEDAGLPARLAADDTAGLAAAQAWLEDPAMYEEAVTVQDGQCLKCHLNTAEDAGVGKTF